MGRTEVYDCADVNDITQILNQAAGFQHSGSSALALRLENLTWTSAAERAVAEQTGLVEKRQVRRAAGCGICDPVPAYGYLKSSRTTRSVPRSRKRQEPANVDTAQKVVGRTILITGSR